jgi:MoaA/NifB/PqqE/SkfB family radical SAM enzyme
VESTALAPHARTNRLLWAKLRFYPLFAWRFFVLRRPEKLIYGLALTDRCNLACRGCEVANTGRPDMSWQSVLHTLENAWSRGFRDLYFSGGEPTLWRDGDRTLEDCIQEARRIGFFHIHLYTNGLRGLDSGADLIWVSMDGLPDVFRTRRGDHFHQVEDAIRRSTHPKIAVIYTIDRFTAPGVEPFLDWVRDSRLPVLGVMFYFHTPYYGFDSLYLSAEERAPVIDRLLECIRSGLPVLNSRAGLRALRSGDWPRRLPVAFVADVDGEYVCCRAPDETCADCGYAACTEITETQRLRPSALLKMASYL